jgi:hypothetical protein
MLDAASKTLLAAYEEAPYTWNLWARQAASVPDFKNINRIRFSEAPNLEMVPENSPYPEGKMSDSKETYQIEKFGDFQRQLGDGYQRRSGRNQPNPGHARKRCTSHPEPQGLRGAREQSENGR